MQLSMILPFLQTNSLILIQNYIYAIIITNSIIFLWKQNYVTYLMSKGNRLPWTFIVLKCSGVLKMGTEVV